MTPDEKVVDAFEAGQIGNQGFPHERHVRVAWGLAQRYRREEALERLVAGIRGIAARAGKPQAYHETITRAWFELIANAEDLERYPELFDKTLLGRYYTAERLAAGQESWLEPDLHPLRLPAPVAGEAETNLRAVLRTIPTSVAVLATKVGGTVHATTISSLASVSRDPALVSICLDNKSRTLALVREARAFTLSILASGQEDTATHFAQPERPAGAGQFADIPHHLDAHGPVLDTAAAWIGCGVHAIHECGDHHIIIGRVDDARASDQRPLLRHNGVYH
jgi:flavin reductase (DIM6/NTAB) family NADH-FMN oxidoreductase RutF